MSVHRIEFFYFGAGLQSGTDRVDTRKSMVRGKTMTAIRPARLDSNIAPADVLEA